MIACYPSLMRGHFNGELSVEICGTAFELGNRKDFGIALVEETMKRFSVLFRTRTLNFRLQGYEELGGGGHKKASVLLVLTSTAGFLKTHRGGSRPRKSTQVR